MRSICFTLIISLILCFTSSGLVFPQETTISKQNSPEISKIEPKEITPGMALKIEGYRLGMNDKSKVIFLQNADEFVTTPTGGSWETANLSQGLQELNVTVPEEILVGKCQIIIEYKGQRSAPLEIDVLPLPKPPKLTSVKPLIATPGEVIWIDGSGFNSNDSAELIDSNGKTHIIEVGSTSAAETSAFTLGENIPDGLVTLRFIENRSGSNQMSNPLTFKVRRAASPLDVQPENLDSVAPGQWFEIVYTSNKPLEKATKIEILLKQDFQEQTSLITDFKNIRVQIPKSFTTGKIEIQNRVWKNQEVSEWSKPIEYEVAETAAKPKIWSFINVPLRAEAMFKQDGVVVETLPLSLAINPEAPIPGKLKDGELEIFTRFWKDGKFTDWNLDRKFNLKKTEFSEKSFEFGNFNEYFYIGNDSPEVFSINRGENLAITGNFFVGTTDELQVVLENTGQKINLRPNALIFLNRLLIKLPRSLRAGDWNISVVNLNSGAAVDIPVKLRIN